MKASPRLFKNIVFAVLLILLSSFSSHPVFAQRDSAFNNLSNRVKNLESYNKDVLDARFNTKVEELNQKIESKLNTEIDEIKDQKKLIKIGGWVIAILIAIGALGFFVGIPKIANKEVHKKLEAHLKRDVDHILDLISSQKTENLIKDAKRILAVCGNDDEKKIILVLLRGMGFKHIDSVVTTAYTSLPDSDLVVLSNIKKLIPDAVLLDFIENSDEDSHFVFYGDRLPLDRNNPHADKVNFANSKYTLYHQILNTLSFKEVFRLEEI